MNATTGLQTAIPGGCDNCDAEQTIRQHGPIIFVTVHHDPACIRLMDAP